MYFNKVSKLLAPHKPLNRIDYPVYVFVLFWQLLAFNFLGLFPFPYLGACGQVPMYQIDFKNIQSLPTFLTEKYNRVFGAPEETRTPKIWLLRPTRIPIPSPGHILTYHTIQQDCFLLFDNKSFFNC